MGVLQAEQPMFGKAGIRPAFDRRRVRRSLRSQPLAAGCSAAVGGPSRPACGTSDGSCAGNIHTSHAASDSRPRSPGRPVSRRPLGLRTDRVLELLQALLTRPSSGPLRSDSRGSQSPRSGRPPSASCPDAGSVRLAPSIPAPPPMPRRLLRGSTQHHEVIRIAHHLAARPPSDGPAGPDRCC